MRIYLDIDSRQLFSFTGERLSRLEFKRRDNDLIEMIFLREAVAQELPIETTARVGLKIDGDYAGEFIAIANLSKSGTGESTVYLGELNLNTSALATAFATEPVTLAGMFEVEWKSGTAFSSSKTLPVTIHNDIIRGDEGEPATLPIFYASATSDLKATQAQAEAGTDNSTWMSPLRTAEAIAALAATDWDSVAGKPATFPPQPHMHAVADITGLQAGLDSKQASGSYAASAHTHSLAALTDSGATPGQVVTYNGTSWVPQNVSTGVTSYDDLTDVPSTFAPSPHTHQIVSVTGLQSALDEKQAAGNYAPATDIAPSAISGTAVITTDARLSDSRTPTAHTHAAADILSGTVDIARIPTGTTSTTVCLGNDSRLSDSRTPTAHTHSAADILSGTLDIARIPTGTTSSTVCLGNDSRLSDSRTPTAHTHGNLTNAGAIGTTSGVPVITGASGVLQAGAFGTTAGTFAAGNHTHTFGTAAGTFCQGNDPRLINLSGGITAIAVVATMPATPSATTLYIVTT